MSVNNQTPRGLKLRNSCDARNLAKVRCSKARPTCARCQSHGIQCVYGVSMRSGKHPANRNSIRKQVQEPPQSRHTVHQRAILPDELSLLPEEDTSIFEESASSMIDPLGSNYNWMDFFQNANDLGNPEQISSVDDSTETHRNYLRPYSEGPIHGSQAQLTRSDIQNLPQDRCPTQPQILPTAWNTSLGPEKIPEDCARALQSHSSATSPSSCFCHQKILQLLFELSQGPIVSLSFEVALNQNTRTISRCHSIISAQDCSNHDATCILNFAALIAKVIIVCKSVYPQCRQNPPSSESSTRSRSTTWNEGDGTSIFHLETGDMESACASASVSKPGSHWNTTYSSAVSLHSMVSERRNTVPGRLSLGAYITNHQDEESINEYI